MEARVYTVPTVYPTKLSSISCTLSLSILLYNTCNIIVIVKTLIENEINIL